MLEREIMCLMSMALALALVFPVAVKCCPGFPSCFPEIRPWVLSLRTVVIRHSLHVMSSVGRALLGCPWAVSLFDCMLLSVTLWDVWATWWLWSWNEVLWSLILCLGVCVPFRQSGSLKDDGGSNRYCPLTLLHKVCLSVRPSSLNSCLWPQKILKLLMKLTPFIPQDLCSHVFNPTSRENMFVPLAGRGPLMNDWTSSLWNVSKSSVKSFWVLTALSEYHSSPHGW